MASWYLHFTLLEHVQKLPTKDLVDRWATHSFSSTMLSFVKRASVAARLLIAY